MAFRCSPTGMIPSTGTSSPTRTVGARTSPTPETLPPRVGFAYDLFGDNRTVLKVFGGMFNFNSADTLADEENPVGRAQLRYNFLDQNGNRQLDGTVRAGLAELRRRVVAASSESIANCNRPTASEMSVNVEREIVPALSGRVSYVYKNIRNLWGEIDAIRTPAYTVPYTIRRHRRRQRHRHGRRPEVPDVRPAAVVPDGADSGCVQSDRVYTNPATTRPTSTPSKSR